MFTGGGQKKSPAAVRGSRDPGIDGAKLDTLTAGSADQVVATAGATATNLTTRTTSFNGNGAGNNITSTLADGSFLGQRKTLRMQSITSAKTAIITPTHFADGTTITLSVKFDWVELEWQTRGWCLVGIGGSAAIA